MRRKIDLYIGNILADIDDQSFILFNWSFTDMENPTAVKNSWSQQITLPGTTSNNSIFGQYFRYDRTTGSGFNALQKTAFSIYDEKGEVLQSGYCRLDGVTRKGRLVTGYKVSLFGGLGSLFYLLSYDDDGNKLTLADLDYSQNVEFTINATNVQSAWTRLASYGTSSAIASPWDIINFMPAYEGIPDKDFDAKKAYGNATDLGVATSVTEDGTTYVDDSSGGTIINFPDAMDGWSMQDLRSYLQRPVLSIKGFFEAVEDYAHLKGWTISMPSKPTNFYRMWKTLPSLPALGSFRAQTGSLTASYAASSTTDNVVGAWTFSGIASFTGVKVTASLAFALRWSSSDYPTAHLYYGHSYASFIFVQVAAYSGSTFLKASDVLCIGPATVSPNPETLADTLTYAPLGSPSFSYYSTDVEQPSTGIYQIPGDIVMELQATGATKMVLRVHAYTCNGAFYGADWSIGSVISSGTSIPKVWNESGTAITPTATSIVQGSTLATYETPDGPRTGAVITKDMLLNSKHTPAEYLIGFAKMFGMVFDCNPVEKTVVIRTRNAYFNTGEDAVDLSDRIDAGAGIDIAPMLLSSKWYEFGQEMAEGAFAKEYKDIYGIPYALQRVNTGYDFDAATVNLLEGSPFRAAVSKLASSPYWRYYYGRSTAMLASGLTQTLWNNGQGKDFAVKSLSPSLSWTYYNTDYEGYDLANTARLELRDADGKAVDGEDILVTYEENRSMYFFHLTDDTTAMLNANGGTPCWRLIPDSSNTLSVPSFSRYIITNNVVTATLDYGTPKEVDIPGITFSSNVTLYEKYWKNYLTDLFSVDTKVMTCRVDFRGMQVGPELLRRFYYYGGSYWVLNKIINYSLTTWDLTECEFIQVQNTENYTDGQI